MASRPGRGMVIAGAIIVAIAAILTIVAIAYFAAGMTSSPQAMSMVFPFLLLAWLATATPTWVIGILLLGLGRQQQRGPVRSQGLAWVLAMAALPIISVLLVLVMSAAMAGTTVVFMALMVSIPVMIVTGFGAGAWLVWGRPRDA